MSDRLYRRTDQRVIAGVAAGLGEYLNIDPVILRIVLIVLTLLNGMGVILYIILWIVLPDKFKIDSQATKVEPDIKQKYKTDTTVNSTIAEEKSKKHKDGNGRIYVGIILIGIGVFFLLERYIPSIDFADLFPVIIIALGALLVFNSFKNKIDKNNEK